MVDSCCAPGCTNRRGSGHGVSFYRIPKDPLRRNRWISAIKRAKSAKIVQKKTRSWDPSRVRLCSGHFILGRRSDDPMSPDYVPSLFANTTTTEKERSMAAMRRYRRCQGARIKKANGGKMSPLEQAVLDYFKSELPPTSSDQRPYSCLQSLCQEYAEKSLVEGQISSGSSETPASNNPAARPSNKDSVSPDKSNNKVIQSKEADAYLKDWLRYNYSPQLKPKNTESSSHLSTNGTLSIPSLYEITLHPTRLHEDYCTPKSVQWASGVWKKADSEYQLQMYSIKVSGKWEWLTVNVMGPLPETRKGRRFLLIITDLYTKWAEACPMRSSAAREVALHIRNLVCQLGVPRALFSQLSKMFVKAVNKALGVFMAMDDCSLVVYHPRACSLDPVTYTDVNSAVTKLVEDRRNRWDVHLHSCLFSLRLKDHPITGQSPFSALYRRDPQNDSRKDPQKEAPDTLLKLAEGLSDDHPISRILASPPPTDTEEPRPSSMPATQPLMGVSIVLTGGLWLGGVEGLKLGVGKGPGRPVHGLQGGVRERSGP